MAMSAGAGSVYAQAIGAFSSAVGSYYSAKSQKSSLKFQADMAELSAKRAEISARQELEAGEFEEQKARLATAQVRSSQRTHLAASGVDLGVGSALLALASTDLIGEVDAVNIKVNATRAAWGHRQQATNLKNEALIGRANAAGISPGVAAMTSLIGGATDVSSSFMKLGKEGALDSSPRLKKLYTKIGGM